MSLQKKLKGGQIYNINNRAIMEIQVHQNERYFTDFLQRQQISQQTKDFTFDIDSFRQNHPSAAQDIIKDPSKYYRIMKNFIDKAHTGDQTKKRYEAKLQHYNISFSGSLGANFVTPRTINSKYANELVGITGIITKMDVHKCQLQKSVHWCQKTKSYEVKEYPDNFNPEKQFEPQKTRFIKTHDDNNNPLSFEYGMSSFRSIQNVVLQELPEKTPPGLLPLSINIVLTGDLVDRVKPGDRVQMIGIYKLISSLQSKERGIFRPYFISLSIKHMNQTIVSNFNNKLNLANLRFPPNEIFNLFGRSIAPSIHGHQRLKKAVLLMLLGGVEKNLENKTHLRGDINVLMVGDPGTAKSQMLRWVLSTVDLGIGTTGSGASGVGLTAAIVSDRDTGQKTLEAGAMVLADRGFVCIDQFDKMNENDRVAVHQVMEQQTVTIAKAGMHCSLNARCSVIAAANPIYGQYKPEKPPTANIGMPDSLLSRFDLIFIIRDEKNSEKDQKIAERVCRNHRLAHKICENENENKDEHPIIDFHPQKQEKEMKVYEKNQVYKSDEKNGDILSQLFLKSYIKFCKQTYSPVLTDKSITLNSHLWSILRQEDFHQKSVTHNKVLPITIRSLQTLIRLGTAHAKLRQSDLVEACDCIQAFKMMIYCLYGDDKALDDQLKQTLKDLSLSEHYQTNRQTSSSKHKEKSQPKRSMKKMETESEGLTKKMAKIDINKDQKEADNVIQRAIEGGRKPTKEEKSIVYRALTIIRKTIKGGQPITLEELKRQVDTQLSEEAIGSALGQLDIDGKIHYDPTNERIYP